MSGYTSVSHFVRGEKTKVSVYRGEEGGWFSVEVRDAEDNRFKVTFDFSSAAARDEMVKELGVAAIRA